MLLRTLRHRPRRSLLFFITLALLFTQGVRLCVHPELADTAAPAVHIESIHSTDADASDDGQHLSQGMALVKLALDISFVFLVAALWLAGIFWQSVYLRPPFHHLSITHASWSLRPPLRAPPF